jgi:F0F1-type ATP synthase membrane subunit a
VRLTRVMMVLGLVFYLFLWVLVANGANELEAPLLIPLVLVVLIVAGLGLDRYMGITPRKQHFQEPDDETEQ